MLAKFLDWVPQRTLYSAFHAKVRSQLCIVLVIIPTLALANVFCCLSCRHVLFLTCGLKELQCGAGIFETLPELCCGAL